VGVAVGVGVGVDVGVGISGSDGEFLLHDAMESMKESAMK
jgi:hypothetical protein